MDLVIVPLLPVGIRLDLLISFLRLSPEVPQFLQASYRFFLLIREALHWLYYEWMCNRQRKAVWFVPIQNEYFSVDYK